MNNKTFENKRMTALALANSNIHVYVRNLAQLHYFGWTFQKNKYI